MSSAEIKLEIMEHGYSILDGEEFVECKDYPDYYVSNKGRFWSRKKFIFLKQRLDGYFRNGKRIGYYFVRLKDRNNKWCNVRVHRQVGLAFVPNIFNKKTLDHIDDNKAHNDSDNLQWLTLAENIRKQHCKPVIIVDLDSGKTVKCSSVRDVLEKFKIPPKAFYQNLNNGITQYNNYEMQYA